jgi:hypothetical protein
MLEYIQVIQTNEDRNQALESSQRGSGWCELLERRSHVNREFLF